MIMEKYEKHTYAVLRIVAGFLFLWHGSQKLFDFPPSGHEIPLHVMLIAGTIEFFGGLLILIGLWTHWAAFAASGLMAYAYWTAHGTNALLPIVNRGEMAMLYCFVFLYLSAKGSGTLSVDHVMQQRRTVSPL